MKRLIILPVLILFLSFTPPRTSAVKRVRKTQVQQQQPINIEKLGKAISLLEPLARKI